MVGRWYNTVGAGRVARNWGTALGDLPSNPASSSTKTLPQAQSARFHRGFTESLTSPGGWSPGGVQKGNDGTSHGIRGGRGVVRDAARRAARRVRHGHGYDTISASGQDVKVPPYAAGYSCVVGRDSPPCAAGHSCAVGRDSPPRTPCAPSRRVWTLNRPPVRRGLLVRRWAR